MANLKVIDAYRIAIKTLEELPDKTLKSKTGKRVTLKEVAALLRTIVHWCHPELSEQDIQKVVRCEKCKHYKLYKKKSGFKPEVVRMCDKDRSRKSPDFFCKDGVER